MKRAERAPPPNMARSRISGGDLAGLGFELDRGHRSENPDAPHSLSMFDITCGLNLPVIKELTSPEYPRSATVNTRGN